MLPAPPDGDVYLTKVVAYINTILALLHPIPLGWRHDGTNLHLRFAAPIDALKVRVHVQSTDTGGPAYTSATSLSSTEVDCRSNRVQDVQIADLPYQRHYVWLIPVQEDGAGTSILYDGESGRPDYMAFLDIGV